MGFEAAGGQAIGISHIATPSAKASTTVKT
jgi:hypothetical protein